MIQRIVVDEGSEIGPQLRGQPEDRRHVDRDLQDSCDKLRDVAIPRTQAAENDADPDRIETDQHEARQEQKRVPRLMDAEYEIDEKQDQAVMEEHDQIAPRRGADERGVGKLNLLDQAFGCREDRATLVDQRRDEHPGHQAAAEKREIAFRFLMPQIGPDEAEGKYEDPQAQGRPERAESGPAIATLHLLPTEPPPKIDISDTGADIAPRLSVLRNHP